MQSHQVRLLCCVFSDEKGFWNCDGHAAWIQIVTCCQASDTAAENSKLQLSLHIRLLNPSAATNVQVCQRDGNQMKCMFMKAEKAPQKNRCGCTDVLLVSLAQAAQLNQGC